METPEQIQIRRLTRQRDELASELSKSRDLIQRHIFRIEELQEAVAIAQNAPPVASEPPKAPETAERASASIIAIFDYAPYPPFEVFPVTSGDVVVRDKNGGIVFMIRGNGEKQKMELGWRACKLLTDGCAVAVEKP